MNETVAETGALPVAADVAADSELQLALSMLKDGAKSATENTGPIRQSALP